MKETLEEVVAREVAACTADGVPQEEVPMFVATAVVEAIAEDCEERANTLDAIGGVDTRRIWTNESKRVLAKNLRAWAGLPEKEKP